MRLLVQLQLFAFMAVLAQATAPVPTPTPTPASVPPYQIEAEAAAARLTEVAVYNEKRLLGICIPWLPWLGGCTTSTKRTSTSKSSSSTRRSSTVRPTSTVPPTSTQPPTTTPVDPTTTPDPSSTPPVNCGAPVCLPQSSVWSYPQAPIPARTASAPNTKVTGGGYISRFPRTRYITLQLGKSAGAPDGYLREMYTINNQFPGPIIEANEGDTLEIKVTNNLDMPQSIHWHGIRQYGTNWADGVPGISQCGIPAGKSFTYRFTLDSEYGTYWYHSHYSNSMADGLYGALIVHSRNDPLEQYQDYDDDRVMFLSDWNHYNSDFIIHRLHNISQGFRGQVIPTQPDSVIINGVGQTDCTKAQPGSTCNTKAPTEIKAKLGSKVRFRLVNTGALAQIRMSIDQHLLKVIEVDDTPIEPVYVHEISIDPGQRYSVVVHLNQGGLRSAFWIRANVAAGCLFGGFDMGSLAILRYTDFLGIAWSSKNPTSAAWPNLATVETPCDDLDNEYTLKPLVREDAPASTFISTRMDSAFGNFVEPETKLPFIGFGYNGKNFHNQINYPLFQQIQDGLQINGENVAAATWDQEGAADLLINQLDQGLAHPFHLHGRPFYIVGRGSGTLAIEDIPNVQLNLTNPLRRDTITIPSASWAILRVKTDNPGVWPLHCHIGWHLAAGKLGVIVVRPNEIKRQKNPNAWANLCAGLDRDAFGPARRDFRPPQGRDVEDELVPVAREVSVKAQHLEQRAKLEPRIFSMDRSSYVLIEGTSTVRGSITVPDPGPTPAAAGVQVFTEAAATQTYAGLVGISQESAAVVWESPGGVADSVKADGDTPKDSTVVNTPVADADAVAAVASAQAEGTVVAAAVSAAAAGVAASPTGSAPTGAANSTSDASPSDAANAPADPSAPVASPTATPTSSA